jgi:hypothetical protein
MLQDTRVTISAWQSIVSDLEAKPEVSEDGTIDNQKAEVFKDASGRKLESHLHPVPRHEGRHLENKYHSQRLGLMEVVSSDVLVP